jgi:CDP-diglyceride synthetase
MEVPLQMLEMPPVGDGSNVSVHGKFGCARGAGIINFVLNLEKNHYLYQFGQFAWTHMILLVVFIPTSFFVRNIFDGLMWFLLPCALVIVNDISAYLTGASDLK